MSDALLATVHHLAVFTVFGVLLSEHMLLRLPPAESVLRLLGRIDLIYGIGAGVVLLIGIARLFLGAKGLAFYIDNPMFWAKMLTFLIIGLISIFPTLQFIRWNMAFREKGELPDAMTWAGPMRWIRLQLSLFVLLLLFAALMARGIGLGG